MLRLRHNQEFDASKNLLTDDWEIVIPTKLVREGFIKDLGGTEFLVLITVMAYMDEDGKSFPSQELLAENLGVTRKTVREALKKLIEKNLLAKKKVGVYYEYYFPETELQKEKRYTAKDVLVYFSKKYEEKYGVPYNISWARETSMVKKKLLTTYDVDLIFKVIETVFEQYDVRWSNKKYQRPTVGALCTWLFNEALTVVQEKEKKEQEVQEALNKDYSELDDLFDKFI